MSIFAIGLTLFLITLGLNIVSRRIIARFREVYE
jgi:phosphate transport system permease protein